MAERPTFLIVGASLTGAKAAETLREEGFDGRVILVGAEPHRPYERPPLSKDYLQDGAERDSVYVHPEGFYAEQEVELLRGREVTAVDPEGHTATLSDGETLGWARLLLATGSEPRRLPIPGADLDGVHVLRTLDDCDRLRDVIAAGGRLFVIGAGWIGAEAAASARTRGMEVTMVEQQSVPLQTVLGAEVGRMYADVHRDHGVELLTGTGVEAIEGDGRAERVRLAGGRTVECAAVLVGVGAAPRTALAEAAGLAVDNGVLVDATLRAGGDVFAAGDIANAEHPFYGRRVRVEHWANAVNQGPAAARAMLGRTEPFERLPYFFSDQYDVGMEYSGLADPEARIVVRGDLAAREAVVFWLGDDGAVMAGMNINVWDVNEHVQALIRSRAAVDPDRLVDQDVPLEALTG
ncbi:MAG TPA: FAD-dependent oxidoreductase [Miltoncostaeaceae bacterium]|nr:FAD-dependent oxidoreductase [Miltoncostaeaceae bacterium]